MRYSLLNQLFFRDSNSIGLSSLDVLKYQKTYIDRNLNPFKTSEKIESEFRWLITLGVLRREVDGQGLTSKVRLTPLGRVILENKEIYNLNETNNFERLKTWISRKFLFQ